MPKKELLVFMAIVTVGFLDWLTTVSGVIFFGATEVNPLLAGLTQSSLILFSVVKLLAVVAAGFAFYKATAICTPSNGKWDFTGRFLQSGYSLTLLALVAVVSNNLIAILRT